MAIVKLKDRIVGCAIYAALFLSITSMDAAGDLANANNTFAIDLYRQLLNSNGNLVISPFSIDAALAMACAGARGRTASQMAEVLHFSSENADVHSEFASLLTELNEASADGCELEMANSLWAQVGFPFLKPFQELLRRDYGASLNEIDLTGWPNEFNPTIAAAARKRINDWVAERTRAKIFEMLPPRLPDPETRLILVNAVSFKGTWINQFDKAKTTDSPFHSGVNKEVSVPTMHLRGNFRYGRTEWVQVLELPYVSNRLSMIILLPRLGRKLADFEKTLSPALIEQLRQRCETQVVSVSLPRFKVMSNIDLKKPLTAMGIPLAFSEGADFSGITLERPFFIEDALHGACVDVDEAGTEAAAATLISFARSAPDRFVVDRPFLFLIRENKTGVILFFGRVVDPSKQ